MTQKTKTNGAKSGTTIDAALASREGARSVLPFETVQELENIGVSLRSLREASVADGLEKYDVWRIANDLDARLRRVIDNVDLVRNPKDSAS